MPDWRYYVRWWMLSAGIGVIVAGTIMAGLAVLAVWGSLLLSIMTVNIFAVLFLIVWIATTLFIRYRVSFPIA